MKNKENKIKKKRRRIIDDFSAECDGDESDDCLNCGWYDTLRGCVLVKKPEKDRIRRNR